MRHRHDNYNRQIRSLISLFQICTQIEVDTRQQQLLSTAYVFVICVMNK